jgi:hypothetical protein
MMNAREPTAELIEDCERIVEASIYRPCSIDRTCWPERTSTMGQRLVSKQLILDSLCAGRLHCPPQAGRHRLTRTTILMPDISLVLLH